MENKIKFIFVGTPDFGLPAFRALLSDSRFECLAAICQPDKPIGRDQILTPPPIKVEALKRNLKVMQPVKMLEIADDLKRLSPDVMVVAAYAKIVPEEILAIPRYGCINIHGSLLPKYRGASVIQAAIANGDKETGITIMKMDKNLDTGPLIAKFTIPIAPDETAESLFAKLSELGGKTIIPSLWSYINGDLKPVPQDNKEASYVGMLKKEDGRIDWNKSAVEIERFTRAMHPWPGAWTLWQNRVLKIIKIIQVERTPHKIEAYKPGQIFLTDHVIAIQCGIDALVLEKLKLEGKHETSAESFIRGHSDFVHSILT